MIWCDPILSLNLSKMRRSLQLATVPTEPDFCIMREIVRPSIIPFAQNATDVRRVAGVVITLRSRSTPSRDFIAFLTSGDPRNGQALAIGDPLQEDRLAGALHC